MWEELEIEQTADGSDTLYIPRFEEHYHSTNGAVQESNHVFIESGLKKIACHKADISILEIGFGTGLNTLLTVKYSQEKDISVCYMTLELYPLPLELINRLHFPDRDLLLQLHQTKWEEEIYINPHFCFFKTKCDFTRLDFNCKQQSFDLIYFDAFSPDKQSEMWTQNVFDYLYQHTNPQGILVTYCAKGVVRRMMQQAGYIVERMPGPPGKREMLRAIKNKKTTVE